MSDPITIAAIGVGGAIAGALATVGAAFLRRGTDKQSADAALEAAEAAVREAIATQFKALMEEGARQQKQMLRKIECLETEIHELKTELKKHGIDPPRGAARFSAETATPD